MTFRKISAAKTKCIFFYFSDVYECEENPCEGGICNNFEGGFYCSCNEGMKLDKTNLKCVDLDECATAGYCENGKCENLPGGQGFICICEKGYVKTVDGKSCEGMKTIQGSDQDFL